MKPFEDSGKSLFCELGELNPSDMQHQIMLSVFARIAGMDRLRIRRNTTSGRNVNRHVATIKSDPLPVGVKFVRDDPKSKHGKFVYTEDAERVKEAFHRVLKGDTITSIAKDLGFSSKQSLKTTLRSWWWVGIKASTKKRVDVKVDENGKYTDGKKVDREQPIFVETNLATKPLVSRERFDAVMDILKEHRRTWTQSKSRRNDFLGTGLIVCRCGKKMYAKGDNRPGKPQYYICSTRYGDWCGNPNLKSKDVDDEIWWSIMNYLTDENFVAQKVKEALSTDEQENVLRKRKALEKVVAGLERKKKNVIDAIENGGADADLLQRKNSLNEDIANARQNLRLAASVATDSIDVKALASHILTDFWHFSARPMVEQKKILSDTVDRISIAEDGHAEFVLKIGMPEPTPYTGVLPTVLNPSKVSKERVLAKKLGSRLPSSIRDRGNEAKHFGRQNVNPTTNGYPAARHAFK